MDMCEKCGEYKSCSYDYWLHFCNPRVQMAVDVVFWIIFGSFALLALAVPFLIGF